MSVGIRKTVSVIPDHTDEDVAHGTGSLRWHFIVSQSLPACGSYREAISFCSFDQESRVRPKSPPSPWKCAINSNLLGKCPLLIYGAASQLTNLVSSHHNLSLLSVPLAYLLQL